MPRYDFDMFTIGAGSGGVASSRRAGSYGARVAICEDSRVGGTCVIRGCVPKKLLVYGAQFADAFADAAGFGWTVPVPSFDWPALIDAKDREIERLSQIYRNMLKNSGVELIEGRGVLVDPHTVEIDGRAYTADKILVATGSHPTVPDIPGIQHVISSNEALDLPALPRRIVIVGGGYIAVEFAGIFNGFGAEVVELIRREELLYGFDDDIRIALAHEMRGRGVEIHARTQVARIEKHDHGYSVYTAIGQEFSADVVMYATGRNPNTRGLGLAEIGVETTENGAVVVDEWSCSNIPDIYAVGDVTDRINLTPVAIAEGRAVAETLFNDNPIKMDHANVPVGGIQPAADRRGRPDRSGGAPALWRGRHLQRPLQADEEHLVRARGAHPDEARRRCAQRAGARLPHARPRRPRDHAGSGDCREMRRLETHVRRDRRHPPERRRGIRDDAREGGAADEIGGGVVERLQWVVACGRPDCGSYLMLADATIRSAPRICLNQSSVHSSYFLIRR